jgi:beta-galactosidase
MGGRVATWANERQQKMLWEAKPVKGEIGIVVIPESQIQCYLLEGKTDHYSKAARGAYQGFLFNNVQPDFVYADDISKNEYEVLYLPHPLLLPVKVANDLKEYVRKGGILISEGCPAYYGDHGRAGEHQPNYGLDELFGATEARVQFTPVLLEDMNFNAGSKKVKGGVYLQAYKPTTGKITGTFEDGSPAIIDNRFGEGKTRLIGTCPGYGNYGTMEDDDTFDYFGSLLKWAGKKQHVKCSDSRLVARIHEGRDYKVLWVISSAREDVSAEIELSERWGSFEKDEIVVNNGSVNVSGNRMSVTVPARDTTIIKFS